MNRILLLTAVLFAALTVNAFANVDDTTNVDLNVVATFTIDSPATVSFGTLTAADLDNGQKEIGGATLSAFTISLQSNVAYDLSATWAPLTSGSDTMPLQVKWQGGNFSGGVGEDVYADTTEVLATGDATAFDFAYLAFKAGDGVSTGSQGGWLTPLGTYTSTVTFNVAADS